MKVYQKCSIWVPHTHVPLAMLTIINHRIEPTLIITHRIMSVYSCLRGNFFSVSFTAMVLMYLTYTWGNHVHEQSKRKNAADLENDK